MVGCGLLLKGPLLMAACEDTLLEGGVSYHLTSILPLVGTALGGWNRVNILSMVGRGLLLVCTRRI